MGKWNYLKYAFFKERSLPIHLGLIATYRCNSRCKSCFLWQDPGKGKELSVKEFEKISKALGKILWLQVGGGEPFLRDDLAEICCAFDATTISIPTNALLPGKIFSDLEKILENGKMDLLQLSISLDGLHEKHDNFRGVSGNFEKVLETYNKIQPLRKKFKKFSVSFNTVVSKENEDDLQKIADFVWNLKPDYHSFEFLRGNPRDEKLSLPSQEKVKAIVKIIEKNIKRYGFYEGLGFGKDFAQSIKLLSQDFICRTLTGKKRIMPCYAGRINAFIDSYGELKPCELLDFSFGNLRDCDFDFKKLWFADETKKARDFICDKCFCTHSCIMLTNVLFNPLLYPQVLEKFIELKIKKN